MPGRSRSEFRFPIPAPKRDRQVPFPCSIDRARFRSRLGERVLNYSALTAHARSVVFSSGLHQLCGGYLSAREALDLDLQSLSSSYLILSSTLVELFLVF